MNGDPIPRFIQSRYGPETGILRSMVLMVAGITRRAGGRFRVINNQVLGAVEISDFRSRVVVSEQRCVSRARTFLDIH